MTHDPEAPGTCPCTPCVAARAEANLARVRRSRGAVHHVAGGFNGTTACFRPPGEWRRGSPLWDKVTCRQCLEKRSA